MEIKKNFSHEKDAKSQKIITRRENGTLRVQTHNLDPAMTDPQWEKESDINYIMDKFMKTGQVTHTSNKKGIYADVSEIPDLIGAAQIVREAQNNFEALPSHVREKFNNKPEEMIKFLQNPKNSEEAVQLGLLTKLPLNNDKLNDDLKAKTEKATKKTEPLHKPDPE